MAMNKEFIEFVVEQIDDDCEVTHRMMFGGCTLYSKGKVVGLMTESQLFIKQTAAGRAFIGDVVEAPAYEGAKMSFLIEDKVEDRQWLSELVRVTEQELPAPKPKKKKPKKVLQFPQKKQSLR